MWGTIFPQTARATIIHVMSFNMHRRHANSFTFILIVTCSSLWSFARGSSDVTDAVVVNKTGCLQQKLIKDSNNSSATESSGSERNVRNLNFSTTERKDTLMENWNLNSKSINDNNTLSITFDFSKGNNGSEVSERKLKMKMSKSNVLALLLIPAMWIAGMMPWILPGIKMAASIVMMMNNMAFSSALFSLIRGYLFDTRKEDHIVYLNYGYKNGPKLPHGHHNHEINYKNNPYLYPHKLISG